MSHSHGNLLGEPPATLLPPNPEADAELAAGNPPAEVASRHPTVSAAWAALAEEALDRPERLEGLRAGAVVARAQPWLPALRHGAGKGGRGDR
jgi:hypothetical protein